ncbi:MAG: hypothetical protein ACI9BF_000118 [Candidatus Paceibacteria bacterium]|jgi:hypothetical protein
MWSEINRKTATQRFVLVAEYLFVFDTMSYISDVDCLDINQLMNPLIFRQTSQKGRLQDLQ